MGRDLSVLIEDRRDTVPEEEKKNWKKKKKREQCPVNLGIKKKKKKKE